MDKQLYNMSIYIPEDALESVKNALISIDVNQLGNYRNCMSWMKSTGSWQEMPGANPNIHLKCGEVAREYLLNVIVEEHRLKEVMEAVRKVHPYETPVIFATKIDAFSI